MFDKTREKLLELHEKHGRGMFNILKARANREIFDRIYELTNEVCRGRDISFSTRCYLIFHGMKDFPECQNENCHNMVIENINSFQTGFHRFCSVKCGSEADSTKKKIGKTKTEKYGCSYFNNYEKTKRTNMERYGVQHTFQTENNREKAKATKLEKYGNENYVNIEKMKKTNLERYGSCCPICDPVVGEKRFQTMMEKYGVKYPLQSEEFKDKARNTCLEMYGDENYRNQEKAKQTRLDRYGDEWFNNREKARQTCLKRYGVSSYCSTDDFKKRIYQNCMERYGVPSYMSTSEFKEKSKNTCMRKYGVPRWADTDAFKDCTSSAHCDDFFKRIMSCNNTTPLFKKEDLKHRDRNKMLKWKCNRCGEEFYSKIDFNYANRSCFESYVRCPNCDLHNYAKSDDELRLLEGVKRMYHGTLISGDRNVIKPKEIDIFLKDISTGIEYDGIFWHSENMGVHSKEMLAKTLLCESKGIRLIRVYSDEWLSDKNHVLWKISTLISTEVHDFSSVVVASEDSRRILTCGEEKIGEYFCHDNIIDGIVIGFSDLRNDFLKGIIDYEKSQGNNVTSLIFDRRLYSTDQIVSLSDKIEYVEQTRYAVYGNSSRHMSGKNRNRIFTHIWDCGYIRMII